jgi:hypothetical protein
VTHSFGAPRPVRTLPMPIFKTTPSMPTDISRGARRGATTCVGLDRSERPAKRGADLHTELIGSDEIFVGSIVGGGHGESGKVVGSFPTRAFMSDL